MGADDNGVLGQISRRTLLIGSLAGVSVAVLPAPRAWSAPTAGSGSGSGFGFAVRPAAFGAVYTDRAPEFAVSGNADTIRWTVRDLWGAVLFSGTQRTGGGRTTLRPRVGDEGYYTLDVTALRKGAEVGKRRIPFAVLAPYRLPADSPFGVNTHLQPPVMVPLMAKLGVSWARTDLTWTDIERPPLAGWSPWVYQADASVELDTAVARSGRAAAKIVNRSPKQDNYFASLAQEVAVRPGTTYTFSIWVKGEDVRALQFTLKPDWGSRIDAPSGTFDWTRVRFDYTTTTETTLTFRVLSNDVTQAAWLDDASVTAAGSDTNLLANPGFERGLASGYAFDVFDPYLTALDRQGINLLPIVDYANPLYDGGLTPHTDAGRAAFAAYVTATLHHYRGMFSALEVYNEWNAGWFTTGPASGDPNHYAALLRSTYEAVKAADPSIAVVGGVTFGTAVDWMAKVFEAGGMAHLDVVSNHPYIGVPESGVPVDEAEREVTELIKRHNGGVAKPIWVSELGWSLGDQPTTAGYLVRGLVLSIAGGVAKFFWYDLVGDQNFGLLNDDPDLTPRPVFVAYAVAIRLLTGRTLASGGELPGTGIRGYVFTGADGDDVAVLWSTGDRDAVAVRTSRPITLLDVVGGSTTLTPSGGQVHLTLTGTPVYLKAPGLAGNTGLVAPSGRVDVSAPKLVHTSGGTVSLTYVLDNAGSARPAELTFTTLGVATRVRAAAGQRAQVPVAIPVDGLELGRNTIITRVGEGSRTVGRLVSTVVVVAVPAGEVAAVGTVDWTDHEFALAPGGYADYPSRFADGVALTVGVDDPARSWPYIHPGPDDGWAGGRAHTFTLNVDLATAPGRDLRLVVFLLDTHNTAPGTVAVALNGGAPTAVTLPAGSGSGYNAGDAFVSGDQPSQFTVVLPAAQLAGGRNVITLTKDSGSWMVYDAIGIYPA